MTESLKERLEIQARAEGFSGFGVTHPNAVPQIRSRLDSFVAQGYHGQMGWLAERINWRGSPAELWPEAQSVVMLAEVYDGPKDLWGDLKRHDNGVISSYAKGRDYHDVVKKRLKGLGRWLIDEGGGDIKVFVDTAPVMEKPLAAAAGLGWQGKHTNLVGRGLGNWFFLGAIFTTLALEPDDPETDSCGTCRACLDVCPTNAFPAPYQLDARRCISYLTIEHRGPVPENLRPALGNRIYGCDDCLAICPWNKFAKRATELRYASRPETQAPELAKLATLDDTAFRSKFSGSPIKRIGRDRFVRNVAYSIGNSANGALLPIVLNLRSDPDPAVSDAAAWAAMRLQNQN